MSKIGHHFRKYCDFIKNINNSDNFWHRKLTLNVRNQDILIAEFRTYVDLPKSISYEKLLLTTQLSYHAENVLNFIYYLLI